MKLSELTAEQGLEAIANSLEHIGNIADDDDALSLESCVGMLCDLGMKAEGVSTGTEAVQQVLLHHEQMRD